MTTRLTEEKPDDSNYARLLRDRIFKRVGHVADDLGMEAYVVGGYVRDAMLRRGELNDIDFVTVGSDEAHTSACSTATEQRRSSEEGSNWNLWAHAARATNAIRATP